MSSFSENQSLLAPWEQVVAEKPDAVAILEIASSRRWTFLEIEQQARKLESELRKLPVRFHGLPVAFRESNGGNWIARFLALLRLQAAALPIDSSVPDAGMTEIAASCRAALWLENGKLRVPDRPHRYRAPAISLLKLTSGTTGIPKALPFRAEELAADGLQILEGMSIGPEQRNFAVIPFGHSYGLGNLVMPLLLKGIPIACGSSPLPHILREEFQKSDASVLPGVPAIFSALAQTKTKLPGLALAISAGAPLRPELATACANLFGKPLHNFFGSSETGGIAFDRDGSAGISGRGIGKLLPRVQVRVTAAGQIAVTSPAVFTRGNRRRKKNQGEVLLPDLGNFNDFGELVLHGRSGRIVKIGARRLDLAEIEHTLEKDPRVRQAWATAWKSGNEERAAAIVETDLSSTELRQVLSKQLPGWKIPRPLLSVANLPLTPRGKPDRERLLQLLNGL